MRLAKTFMALGAVSLLASAAADARTIKIGLILPFSGPNAQLGQQLDRGIRLFLKTNPDVPGGNRIEIIRRDSTGPKPEVAKRLVQEMVTRDRVDLVTGIIYSNNAFAIMDVCKKTDLPFLILNAGTASITTRCKNVARVSFTMWQSAYPLGQYAYKTMGIRTVAVAYASYAPGKDSKTAFTTSFTKAGGKIVADVPFPFPKIPDFTPFLQRVKDSKPDALYVFVPAGKWATGVMKTFGELGMRKAGIKLIGPGDITQDSELPNMGLVPLGVITMHHYSAAADRPANKVFVAAWKKEYGADSIPDFFGVQGWDGMAAIYAAIDKTGGKLGGAATIAAWKGWKYDSPRGPLMIDPETRDVVNNQYLRRVELRDGKLVNAEFDTIPMVRDPWKILQGIK
jgi:branched-chain amino acid transport system substrate-binding protein